MGRHKALAHSDMAGRQQMQRRSRKDSKDSLACRGEDTRKEWGVRCCQSEIASVSSSQACRKEGRWVNSKRMEGRRVKRSASP